MYIELEGWILPNSRRAQWRAQRTSQLPFASRNQRRRAPLGHRSATASNNIVDGVKTYTPSIPLKKDILASYKKSTIFYFDQIYITYLWYKISIIDISWIYFYNKII
jgi:hypothetical protein